MVQRDVNVETSQRIKSSVAVQTGMSPLRGCEEQSLSSRFLLYQVSREDVSRRHVTPV